MGLTEDFHTGVAQLLAANSIGSWNPTGVYTADQFGIVVKALPQAPANVLSLSSYDVDHDPTLADATIGMQIQIRRDGHDPRPADDWADQVFDLLDSRHSYRLETGIWVTQSYQRSRVTGGQDESQRWSTIQNFYFTVSRPSTNRP